jgi:hypothetical protein
MLSRFTGCSSNDSPGGGEGGEASSAVEDPSDEGPDYCDLDAFFRVDGNGGACSPIAPATTCFMECEGGGGCSCVAGPKGTGIWRCQVDTSCMPKCAPENPHCVLDGSLFADAGPIPDTGPMIADVAEELAEDGAPDAPVDGVADVRGGEP